MPKVIRSNEVLRLPSGSVKFEGEGNGSDISFFLVFNEPGYPGPKLHRHPYSEIWIVRAGSAHFTAGELETEATEGDILTIEANTPHKFQNTGESQLELVCIHAAPKMIQEDLE